MAKKASGAVVHGVKSQNPIDLHAIVHRRLTVGFHGVRLTGRVVAAGWKTPLVVYRGD